jgi:hypothetical protein
MKVSMRLTLDGLRRSLAAIAQSMADKQDWRYAGAGDDAGQATDLARREGSRTERHELGGA